MSYIGSGQPTVVRCWISIHVVNNLCFVYGRKGRFKLQDSPVFFSKWLWGSEECRRKGWYVRVSVWYKHRHVCGCMSYDSNAMASS